MSEKRFKFVKTLGFTNLLKKDVFIKDNEKDYYIRYIEEVVDLLNKLNDDNRELRQSIAHMISKATEISNRNVLLHEEIGRQTRLNKELQDKIDWLCEQTGYDGAKFHHIEELKEKLREKEEDEQLYANEIVKLNKEAKEVLNFKTLGGDY